MSSNDSQSKNRGQVINAGIDSSLSETIDERRGALPPEELQQIHQTKSFKQAQRLERMDNKEIAAKMKALDAQSDSH